MHHYRIFIVWQGVNNVYPKVSLSKFVMQSVFMWISNSEIKNKDFWSKTPSSQCEICCSVYREYFALLK